MKRPNSSCCDKPAKPNLASTDGGLFCTHCGQPCETSQRKTPFKGYTTLSPVRKPTGERQVFIELWAKCKGRSVISGAPLLPPEHPMFHFQFAHVLPKSTYPELRLLERNIFPVTIDEHRFQTEHPEDCRRSPSWSEFWKVHDDLRTQAERKRA